MARYLAIDLEQRQVRIAAVITGRGGGRIDQVVSHTFPEDLTPSSGETLGKALRDVLKQFGVAPAPALGCVSRDRVIVKDVRFPPVPQNEEPALVRFQASKELTEAASEVVIDYMVTSERNQPGPRQAMAIVVRKEVVHALDALCRGLGVKLIGVVPRFVSVAAAVQRALGPQTEPVAVLSIGDRWAELCVVNRGKALFSRSLPNTAGLVQDVRRSLMLYAPAAGEGSLPQVLYLGGKPNAELCESWRSALGLKVQGLDPFGPADKLVAEPERGHYVATAGLAQLAAGLPQLPLNFVKPKEPGSGPREGQRSRIFIGIAAAAAFFVLLLFGIFYVSMRRGDLEDLKNQEASLDQEIKGLEQDKPTVDELKNWEAGTVSWLDEMYEVTAFFPQAEEFKVTEFIGEAAARKGPEDRAAAIIKLRGVVPPKGTKLVNEFVDGMMASKRGDAKVKDKKDAPVKVIPGAYKPGEFQLKLDVAATRPTEYRTSMPPAKKVTPKKVYKGGKEVEPVEPDMGEDAP